MIFSIQDLHLKVKVPTTYMRKYPWHIVRSHATSHHENLREISNLRGKLDKFNLYKKF